MPTPHRLRKHADYQHAYAHAAKQSTRQMTAFFAARPSERRSETPGARVGLTVPKAVGKAHERNRIKRRMRAIVRAQLFLLRSPVDVILHPRRSVLTAEFAVLVRETAEIFGRIERALAQGLPLRSERPRSAKGRDRSRRVAPAPHPAADRPVAVPEQR